MCDPCARVRPLGKELSDQAHLQPAPITAVVWAAAWISSAGEGFLLERVFQGRRGTVLELCVHRGAGGAVAGSSLSAVLSPSVACGLILVCARSCYSMGSCQSSDAHAADQPVRVSLFDCLSSWN